MAFRPTVGLEIHAELKTATKMFCSCKNDSDEERPNVNVCPICLAHPGTLPVINKEAVRHVLRLGMVIEGALANFSEFDRKSYFYPDIPKGYQISQYEHPLVSGGELSGVKITRVHLEEDTARSVHENGKSLVDFNRAGIPLMELVTEPVIHDAPTAGNFARELQLLLRTLGASEANLEKGEMRIEANISVSNEEGMLGTKVEVKNLNSFRSVERAIAYEIDRQSKLIEKGEKAQIVQETRGWDEAKQETFTQRRKEGSADYRYFPEPDLPKIVIPEVEEFSLRALRASLPEIPKEKRARLLQAGVSDDAIEIFIQDQAYGDFYDRVIAPIEDERARTAAINLLIGEVRSKHPSHKELTRLDSAFSLVMPMYVTGALSSTNAKASIISILEKGGDIEELIHKGGLLQVHDTEVLREVAVEVIKTNPGVVAEYRAGKDTALQFLVGQAMKVSKGAGNPSLLKQMLVEEIGK